MNADELGALSYRDLQKLAKSKNIKANQPKDVLVAAILDAADETGKLEASFNASSTSSIITEDGKSETETDEDDPKPEDTKPGKRRLSRSANEEPAAADGHDKPKRRRFAEFIAGAKTSSPISTEPTKPASPERVLNVTVDLDKSEEDEEVVFTTGPIDRLNSTITVEKPTKRFSNPRKSMATPVVGVKPPRKSLLNIPLRKSLAGTPGSVRKIRPSAPISAKKIALAAQDPSIPALASVKKPIDVGTITKPGHSSFLKP